VLYLVVAGHRGGDLGPVLFQLRAGEAQYFLGMRFRTLAVAAGQLKSKAESLSAGLTSAKDSVADPKVILDTLIPT